MNARLLPLVVLVLCAAAPAAADEVRLMNGDRITGRVISLTGGTLVFSTPLGDLKIPWSNVTALVVDEPIRVTVGDAEPVLVTIAAATTEQSVALVPGGVTALADVTALARPQPAVTFDGSANAGFVSSAGNTDVNNVHVDGDLAARAGANRYTVSAAINRAEDNDVESARNWSSSIKYDRFLTPRVFANANAIFTNDRFRDLDLRTAIGAGLGYQILQTPVVTLTADAGLGWVNENLETGADDRYTAARESASLTIGVVPTLVEFFHQHDGYFGVTGDDNLFVRMQNGVRVRLAGGFVTTLRLDLDYDRTPAPGRRNTDQTFSLTLGYRF
jgi:putative salt-induced outer membrane protein YdiY